MPKNTLPAIEALFAGANPGREPVDFSWRLVYRKQRPFLLLPEKSGRASESFQLYSAHRPLGKLWRSLISLAFETALVKFFRRVAIEVEAESAFMLFLAEQSGVATAQLTPPAIKFGGYVGKSRRLVLLLRDAGGHPIRVVKVGLNPSGRVATEREADLLSSLPKNVIGCTGITGRFASDLLSAFATAYFPGESLDTDLDIEKLFHDWLNDGSPEPIENLPSWQELELAVKDAGLPEWPKLRDALAGRTVRTTIYHGDFAPWNVRMTNLENIRAFDWERGHLKGIPAWDWFHFIVQTSILVKRYSPERVAAELDHLVRSPRFQKYADDAGIGQIVEPLLLAYLLQQKWVVRPLQGGEQTDRLFRLLWAKWQFKENGGGPVAAPVAGWRMPAGEQIKVALTRLADLFWEPGLSPILRRSFTAQLRHYWLVLLASFLWIGGVVTLQAGADPHLSFVPFYLVPCALLALKVDRRLGFLLALVAGVIGPLMQHFRHPMMIPVGAALWNMVMRVFVFGLMVILLDNVRRESLRNPSHRPFPEPRANQSISGNWAVVLMTGIYITFLVGLNMLTNPYYTFLPLYLLPCIIITLTLNWRWGTLAAVITSVVGPLTHRFDDPAYQHLGVELWNTFMRLLIFQTVVFLLDRIRHKSFLFTLSNR